MRAARAKMDPVAIRPLTDADPIWIAATFAAIGWSKPAEQYTQYIEEQEAGRRETFVALTRGELAGYVTLNRHPAYPPFQAARIPEIQDLNVLPRFRRRGVGSALMDAAEGAARGGGGVVGIGVGLGPDYGPAQRLYVRRGYVPDGRGAAYRGRTLSYGEQVVVDDDLVLYFTKRLLSSPD